ncbi:hypothetical protein ACLOJK_040051 [Asimina triloba]
MLLRLLLEPTLPVVSMVDSEDASFVREILYDAVTLVDYSFLNPEVSVDQYADRIGSLLMLRLIAAHEAIQLVTGCVGNEKPDKPSASTPQAFLKWLLKLEEQGLRVFVDGLSKFHSKLAFDESSTDRGHTLLKPETTRSDEDFFFIDNKGDAEGKVMEGNQEMQTTDAAFINAAHTMKFTAKDGRRKRKEARREEGKTQVKFLKYKLHESYVKENSSHIGADGMNSGSEVENPMSDEDMEEMEQ